MNEDKLRKLELINPSFDSNLTALIIDLEKLRDRKLTGTTHPMLFFQLKHIFHTLESIGSSRIEGNNTTLAEYLESKIEGGPIVQENILEIKNIENAMGFIEQNAVDYPINRAFICEMHKMVVEGLSPPPKGEGDYSAGIYRNKNVKIAQSTHTPPDAMFVSEHMDELVSFINAANAPRYDLLKTAIAHHQFVWIHPFGNGNGRTVRLLTYAMLVKQGFNVNVGRILNPTAVFCSNRDDYYRFLSRADSGTYEGISEWCEYVLKGLKDEIEKIDRLLDYEYLKNDILLPALKYSEKRGRITELEAEILKIAVEKEILQASDIKSIVPSNNPSERSRQLNHLIQKKMLMPQKENGRKYILRFDNNHLLSGIMDSLDRRGFLPIKD